jgi:hypothetical protein
MKHFLKIKRVRIMPDGEMIIVLRCGIGVVRWKDEYQNQQTGEVLEPIYDEFTEELIGFIG